MSSTPVSVVFDSLAPGLNNRRPDFKLSTEGATFLRGAVNTDLTAEGTAKRRPGYAQAISGADCHSLWSNGTVAFYVDHATLYRISGTANAPVKTALRTDMTPGRLVSYAESNGSVYYSNGIVIGRIDSAGSHAVGVTPLAVEPLATASAGGSLPAGVYSVCFTLLNADGEQSGSTIPQVVNVVDNGKITVTGLPATFPAGVVGLNVYCTSPNDGTLLRAATLMTASATVTIAVINALGARCPTLLLAPMPPGNIVRQLNGRLLTAAGAFLCYSEPYAHALTNPARNYIPFPGPVTMVEPCENGVFVAAGAQTYWLAGDITQAELVQVLPFGAVPNTSGQNPDDNSVFWMSTRGMVLGKEDGSIERLQEANVAIEPATTGAFLYRERDGMKQALGGLFGLGGNTVAAGSFIDGEIIRKATTP